jgi:hypothetical protein
MSEVRRGTKVQVRDAFGRTSEVRATSGVVMGKDFEIVWVCDEEEWKRAESESRRPDSIPWPAEDVVTDGKKTAQTG